MNAIGIVAAVASFAFGIYATAHPLETMGVPEGESPSIYAVFSFVSLLFDAAMLILRFDVARDWVLWALDEPEREPDGSGDGAEWR